MKLNDEAHRRLVCSLAELDFDEGDVAEVLNSIMLLFRFDIFPPPGGGDPKGRKVLGDLARAMAKARSFKGTGRYARGMAQILGLIDWRALEMLTHHEGKGRDHSFQTQIVHHCRCFGFQAREGAKRIEPTTSMLALLLLAIAADDVEIDSDGFEVELERATGLVKKATARGKKATARGKRATSRDTSRR